MASAFAVLAIAHYSLVRPYKEAAGLLTLSTVASNGALYIAPNFTTIATTIVDGLVWLAIALMYRRARRSGYASLFIAALLTVQTVYFCFLVASAMVLLPQSTAWHSSVTYFFVVATNRFYELSLLICLTFSGLAALQRLTGVSTSERLNRWFGSPRLRALYRLGLT